MSTRHCSNFLNSRFHAAWNLSVSGLFSRLPTKAWSDRQYFRTTESNSSAEMGMGSEVNADGVCFLCTLARHSRSRHGAIQDSVEGFRELYTDKARKRRGGGGDHLPQGLVGAIGGDSLRKRLGHQWNRLGLHRHSHAEIAEVRLHGRFIDDSRIYTRGPPATRSCFGFLDDGGELEVARLVMIDTASREDEEKHPEPSRECGQLRGSH